MFDLRVRGPRGEGEEVMCDSNLGWMVVQRSDDSHSARAQCSHQKRVRTEQHLSVACLRPAVSALLLASALAPEHSPELTLLQLFVFRVQTLLSPRFPGFPSSSPFLLKLSSASLTR